MPPIWVQAYCAISIIMTLIDFVVLVMHADTGAFKSNILLSHKAYKAKYPHINNIGIITFYIVISLASPIFGILRLYYFIATIEK